ncbi:FMN-binding protein [Micromonospora sp. HM5-17]|uniref:FMN-binding protein n=1 Tax=Micromonospora sp. HM5-17 TaxID=2487710 RepID=UPI000F477249|nr:FMN-binding protein [Micromonospora sp. HM5-17]ROT34067.1 FMN-binding protein [Micromonospora sp. HM5-17]
MRRAAFAVLGTAIGTALLIGAKLGTPTSGPGTQVALDTSDDGAAAGEAGGAARGEPGREGATASPKPAPSSAPATKASAKPPASGGLRDGTFAGATANYAYGGIKVTITVSGGKISDVSATYPTDNPTSASVNERAIPKLRQETLTAQSAKISTVSGASLTSEAYQTSLQSALDKAKA